MSGEFKKNNIIAVVLVFIVVLGGIITMFYVNLQKNKIMEVEATVKLIGDNHIVVEDNNGEEYYLETDEEFSVGDRVDFVIKDIKKDSNPQEGTLVKIDTISRNISFSIKDDNDTESFSNMNDIEDVMNKNLASDADVVSYFTNLDNELNSYNESKNIGDNLKKGFITVVDFIFYDGEIKGKTFDELSDEAKIEVLQIAFSIDKNIEKYFPNYKEEVSTTSKKVYTDIKDEATKLYLDVTTKICDSDPDTCKVAKEGLKDLKTSFSITWGYIKEIGGTGIEKLKDWYEIWKVA